MDRESQQINKRTVIIVMVLAIVVLAGLLAFFFYRQSQEPRSTVTSEQFVDKDSGETYNTSTTSPETYGGRADLPLILGTKFLIDIGLTQSQVGIFRDNLIQYYDTQANNEKITMLSIRKASITQTMNQETGEAVYGFTLVVNQKQELQSKIITDGISSVDVSIENDGKVVYDSTKL